MSTSATLSNSVLGVKQISTPSEKQTKLLGDDHFCLKTRCPGTVYVVELDRIIMACACIPIYWLENRKMVRCRKCFYINSLQAHKFCSTGTMAGKKAAISEQGSRPHNHLHLSKSRSRASTKDAAERKSVDACRKDTEATRELVSPLTEDDDNDVNDNVAAVLTSRMSDYSTGGSELIQSILRQSSRQPSWVSLHLQSYSSAVSFDPPRSPPRVHRRSQVDPRGSLKTSVHDAPRRNMYFFPDSSNEEGSTDSRFRDFDPVGLSPVHASPPSQLKRVTPQANAAEYSRYIGKTGSYKEPSVPILSHRSQKNQSGPRIFSSRALRKNDDEASTADSLLQKIICRASRSRQKSVDRCTPTTATCTSSTRSTRDPTLSQILSSASGSKNLNYRYYDVDTEYGTSYDREIAAITNNCDDQREEPMTYTDHRAMGQKYYGVESCMSKSGAGKYLVSMDPPPSSHPSDKTHGMKYMHAVCPQSSCSNYAPE